MRTKGRNKRKSTQRPQDKALPPKSIVCAVCGKGDGKYKCPKCRAPFCCVQCSKDHKSKHCPCSSSDVNICDNGDNNVINPKEQSEYLPAAALLQSLKERKRVRRTRRVCLTAAADDSNDGDSDSRDDEPGWNITPEMKKKIRQSSWLRKELRDGGLRHLIEMIDAASEDDGDGDDHVENHDYKGIRDNDRNDEANGMDRGECGEQRLCQNQNGTSKQKRMNCHKSKRNEDSFISPRVLALARTKHSHPKFASFIDQLLLTAGVLMPSGGMTSGTNSVDIGGEVMPLNPTQLVLAPVTRCTGMEEIDVDDGDLDIDSNSSSSTSDSESESDDSEELEGSSSSSDSESSDDGEDCEQVGDDNDTDDGSDK